MKLNVEEQLFKLIKDLFATNYLHKQQQGDIQ